MRKTALVFILITFLNLLIPLFSQKALADDLTNTYIRLDRQAVNTSTGGLVCSTTPTSDNGTENRLQIIFPSGFTVNQTASNWTVSTSDIPQGTNAWPGISTAISVSGQTVTFPSSNLSPSTSYCFTFSSSNTLTTPGSTGSYQATVRTQNGTTTIDDTKISLAIIANDKITVTATVDAKPIDFQAEIDLVSPRYGTYAQNTGINYAISYGSFLNHPSSITIEAEWTLGTIEGVGIPTEDILDYVIGSATNAHGSSPPVVDLVNKKITWSISPFPSNTTDQQVSFTLKTNDSYKQHKNVRFTVKARVLGPGTQTADSTISSTYLNLANQTGASSPCEPFCPTSAPTSAPQTSTTTEVSQPQGPEITNVEIRTIRRDSAQIEVENNNPSAIRLSYGTSPTSLNQSVSLSSSLRHLITLSNLEQNTRYFFRILATDDNGNTTTSDVFSLDTASDDLVATAVEESLFLSSGDVILLDPTKERVGIPKVVIPKNTRFSFKFIVDGYNTVKAVEGIVRDNNVLGIATHKAYAATNSLTVTELYPGHYIGSITTSDAPGNYSLLLRITDFSGNINEQEVSNLLIVDFLNIINIESKAPVEKAKATFYFYNSRTKTYELISNAITPFDNPAFSNTQGFIPIVLPEGKYRAEVVAIGYESKTIEFDISPSSPQYPTIELEPGPFSVATFLNYHFVNSLDALGLLNEYIDSFKNSSRYFELITFGVIALFIILSFFQLSRVFGVPVYLLPFFALYHFFALFYRPKHPHFIQGKVVDILTNEPIEGVLLHFSTPRGKVFAHARTNIDGDFAVNLKMPMNVKINVSKKGYSTFTKPLSKEELDEKLTVTLSKSQKPEKFGLSAITWYFKSLGESFFETFLVLTIIIELIFAQQFGIGKAIIPLIISIGNLLLWALHARPRKAATRRA